MERILAAGGGNVPFCPAPKNVPFKKTPEHIDTLINNTLYQYHMPECVGENKFKSGTLTKREIFLTWLFWQDIFIFADRALAEF